VLLSILIARIGEATKINEDTGHVLPEPEIAVEASKITNVSVTVHVLSDQEIAALAASKITNVTGHVLSEQEIALLGWPFLMNYRDPNKAWDFESKVVFFLVYSLAWACITMVVYCRTHAVSPRLRPAPQSRVEELSEQPKMCGATPTYPEGALVHELILEQNSTRSALIVADSTESFSYDEVKTAISELAEVLVQLGLEPGCLTALCMERSCAQVIAVLGVLASGGCYLPIDAASPEARVGVLLRDSAARVVIADAEREGVRSLAKKAGLFCLAPNLKLKLSFTLEHKLANAPSSPSDKNCPCVRPPRPRASDAAMLIYTSGTTGTPKGIIYDHRHLLHGAWFWAEAHGMSEQSVQLLKSPYFWAVMEWEFFPALMRGGSLVVASRDGHKSPDYMAHTVQRHDVNILMITPSVLDLLMDAHQLNSRLLSSLRHVTTVGEPLTAALANRVVSARHLQVTLRNFYGASESSCTIFQVPADGVDEQLFSRVPAGRPQPYANVYLMVAGERPLRLAPAGQPGEICFGGVLASGYLNRPDLTAEKFVETEYGRLYATGDLGRWTQGVLEVIGRIDRQLKVNGVRVEPEEIEATLLKFAISTKPKKKSTLAADVELGEMRMCESLLLDDPQWAVARAAVVATSSSQLVAFVSAREGVKLDPDELHAYCAAQLASAYVPQHIVVLDEGLPILPNGKINFASLKLTAEEHVQDAVETVRDSLGQMRSMSKWAVLENEVIHRCYAFWMIGVLLDHYALCAMITDPNDPKKMDSLPFCTTLAASSISPWSEAIIRSIGNDQDLFGFIMLGAYQDSRPSGAQRKRLRMSWMDLYMLGIYLFMALPLPQICKLLTGGFMYPTRTWEAWTGTLQTNGWDQHYMEWADVTSGHRWYLLMLVQAKAYVVICDAVRIPPWAQVFLAAWCSYVGPVWGGDACTSRLQPVWKYFVTWLLDGCWVWIRWVEWYAAFYVFCFHYLRPIVSWIAPRLPKGPVWASVATSSSMIIGMFMALFHYPNAMLESGDETDWGFIELGVTMLQPALFALGTTHWSINASWWGNTTLGCYVIHFLFRDRMTELFQVMASLLAWDGTGLLLPTAILLACLAFTSTVGPLGHYILIAPQLCWTSLRARRVRQSCMLDKREK